MSGWNPMPRVPGRRRNWPRRAGNWPGFGPVINLAGTLSCGYIFGAAPRTMRLTRCIFLFALVALSSCFLFSYGRAAAEVWSMGCRTPICAPLSEPALWLYQERDQQGRGRGPLRFYSRFSVPGPWQGYHSVLRIPGWAPALAAFGILVYAAFSFSGESGDHAP